MNSITYAELMQWQKEQKPFQLIDVRTPEEHHLFNIGGQLLPLDELMNTLDCINPTLPTVLYCAKGIRSVIAIQKLQSRFPDTLFYNLKGGIAALQQSEL